MGNNPYADKIFINGKVYMVDQNRGWAEAVAVMGKRILAVGRNEEILSLKGNGTEVVDLNGKMMLPGFVESHAHPIIAAFFKSGILLEFTMNISEIVETVRSYIAAYPDREVYFGQGYSEWLFGNEGPRKEILDEICPDKPLLLIGGGLHSAWCNSKALEMAGVTADTPDPDPGAQFYRRLPDGSPSGSLVESDPIGRIVAAIKPFRMEDVRAAFEQVSAAYTAAGVTSINDGGIFSYIEEDGRRLVAEISKEKGLRQRMRSCGFVTVKQDARDSVKKTAEARELYNDESFRVDYLKILNDGSTEARSCAMLEPFEDEAELSVHPMIAGKALQALCLKAAEAGMDIHVHAIGDWTIRETLDMARVLREKGYMDTRIVNIHSNYVAEEDLERFAQYNVVANTTPVWFYDNPVKVAQLGEKRASRTFLMNTLYKKGVLVAFSSDFPADEYGKEPMRGIEMGVTRQLFGKPESPVLQPLTERMTVRKMIEGYTINAAYQMRMEDKIGSIVPGKYADFVVLSENLFEIDPHDIHEVKVDMTVFDGKIIYKGEVQL